MTFVAIVVGWIFAAALAQLLGGRELGRCDFGEFDYGARLDRKEQILIVGFMGTHALAGLLLETLFVGAADVALIIFVGGALTAAPADFQKIIGDKCLNHF